MQVKFIPANSNNFEKGRRNNNINLVVLHWIVGTLESIDATFADPKRFASAHYGIGDGEIHQYVKDEDTAFHAGVFDINLKSIGIEHEGSPNLPITDATYQTSAQFVEELCRKYRIPLDRDHIKGHKEFKATQCPGTLDIDRIIREAKSFSPQSVIDKLRNERDQNWNLYQEEKKKNGVNEAHYEELRKIIREKDEKITQINQNMVILSIKNTELTEEIIKLQETKNIFTLMKQLFKKFINRWKK